jgi:hypothetical protein
VGSLRHTVTVFYRRVPHGSTQRLIMGALSPYRFGMCTAHDDSRRMLYVGHSATKLIAVCYKKHTPNNFVAVCPI